MTVSALNGLSDIYPHWEGPSACLSSPVHKLISSRKILIDTPRNTVLPAAWASWPHQVDIKLTTTQEEGSRKSKVIMSLKYSLILLESKISNSEGMGKECSFLDYLLSK